MAGALTAFRRATAAARTIESADARLKALDKTLASTISAPPAGRAAAALWPEYQAAVQQARELREEARARQAEEEKERKRLEAEKAAKGREVATLVADADKAIAAKRFDDAAGLLDRGSTLLPDSTDLARARTRLARAVDAEEKRANRQQVKGLLDQVPAAVDGARFAEAGERLTEAEGLGATPAEAGPLRENLRAAEVAHAQISGALAALKEAVASARATPAMEARVKALDAALATPISAAPTPRAAAGLWPEYQDALQQARGLRQEAAIAEARRRVELALSERSVRKAERALQAAEGAFPGGARWNALRQQVDALRAARAAEPSLLGSTVRQVRQNPLALWIAAAVLAVVLGAAAWVLWPKGPVDPAGKTPPETPAKSSGNPNPAVPAGSPEPAPSDNKPAPADPPSAPAKPPVTAPAAGTPPPTLTPADRARLTLMLNEGQLAQMVSAVQTFRGRGIVDSTLDTMERDAVRIQRSRVSNARQGAGKVPGAAGTAAYREAQKFEQEGNAPRTPSAAFSSLAQAERLYRQAANEAPPVNTPPVPSAGGATTPSSLPGAPAGTPEPPAGGKPPETRPVDKPADPKPTPPPPANPPAASPSAPSDEALIQQTLQQYSAAMSAMNPAAVAAVYPGANRGMLANTFRGFSEYRYQLQPASPVQINGNSATARCTLKMQTNSGQQGRQTQPDRNLVVRLAKTGNRWVIVGFGG
nr:hypothetical protein [Acidobacteriota bacterium]